MAQVYVVVAAGSVIAFIIRDLGSPSLAGWIIQGPLLMQSVLSPLVGRLSDVLDGLASLVAKSLVRQDEGPDGEPRFGMLETIREFGLEQLEAGDELVGTQRRHAEHFVGVAEDLERRFAGAGREPHVRRFTAEHDNLRAALGWSVHAGEAEIGLRLVGALWSCWPWGHVAEGRRWAQSVLALPGAAQPSRGRGRALTLSRRAEAGFIPAE